MKTTVTQSPPNTPKPSVPVFLIDDNRLLRDGLSAMLGERGLNVVATARSGQEAMREFGRVKPQLVLLDSALAESGSPQFVQELRQNFPEIKVIVMGFQPAHEEFFEFIKAGVVGFILRDATIEVFVETIMAVADGEAVLPPLLTSTLFTHVAAQGSPRRRGGVKTVRMTARERQVMESIAEGLSNKEIAERLHVATHTIKSHVHNILEKLALNTRLQIAAYAHAEGAERLVAA